MQEPRNRFRLEVDLEGGPSGGSFSIWINAKVGQANEFSTLQHLSGDMVFERTTELVNNALRPLTSELERYLQQQRKKGR